MTTDDLTEDDQGSELDHDTDLRDGGDTLDRQRDDLGRDLKKRRRRNKAIKVRKNQWHKGLQQKDWKIH